MKPFKQMILAASLGLACMGNAFAVDNGNFGNGLAGWNALGDVSVQSGAALLTSASLGFEDDFPSAAGAFNFSGVSAAEVGVPGGVEDFAGLTIGDVDAYEGSVLKQTFAVQAGDTLSFDWNFLSNDVGGADYAFVVIDGVLAAGLSGASNSGLFGFAAQTGTQLFNHVFSNTGSVTLALGVVDVGDFNSTSALLVDNVTVTPVPEPETYALMLGGLGLLGAMARRRRA